MSVVRVHSSVQAWLKEVVLSLRSFGLYRKCPLPSVLLAVLVCLMGRCRNLASVPELPSAWAWVSQSTKVSHECQGQGVTKLFPICIGDSKQQQQVIWQETKLQEKNMLVRNGNAPEAYRVKRTSPCYYILQYYFLPQRQPLLKI